MDSFLIGVVVPRSVYSLIVVGSALLVVLLGDSVVEADDRKLTFDQILEREVSFGGRWPRASYDATGDAIRVGSDGWQKTLTGQSATPVAEETTSRPVDEGLREALEELIGDSSTVDRVLRGRRNRPLYSKDGNAVLVATTDALIYRTVGQPPIRYPHSGERRIVTLSDDGKMVSWVEGNDLKYLNIATGTIDSITEGGSENLLHGILDWVYQEEVYGRGNFRGHWWSPTGSHVAFLRLDETKVPEFHIVDHVPARQERTMTRYPKAGDPNPVVSVGIHGIDGKTNWVDLSNYGPGDGILVVRVDWSPAGDQLLLQVQDRLQQSLDLLRVDPETGDTSLILREVSDSWVNVMGPPRWLEDGSFLWFSERTGFRHLYHYAREGVGFAESGRAITVGDWEFRRIIRLDEVRNEVWFSGSMPSPVESHLYRVSLNGGVVSQLTNDPGTHSVTIAPTGDSFIDRYSSHQIPGETRLCDRNGKIIRVLNVAEVSALGEYDYSHPERHQISARDGYLMEAMVFKPTSFDSNQSYPVFLMTYSGPDSPSVRDRWQSDPWKQFLCQQGMILLQVNNRSSSGRGQRDTETCYRRLGVGELSDLEDAIDWITSKPWADENRVGITGWSYGGFISAYAMTHSSKFSLGIAGAGVYDWRLYDTIYTERYMQTPALNPEGYAETSVIEGASGLSGHLLIVHGMDDDNVHAQNAMQLVRALQRAGKQFEMMVYPTATHGIRDPQQRRHHRTLVWITIQEHLLN